MTEGRWRIITSLHLLRSSQIFWIVELRYAVLLYRSADEKCKRVRLIVHGLLRLHYFNLPFTIKPSFDILHFDLRIKSADI
jgi:hypothetical protein